PDPSKSLDEGAIEPWTKPRYRTLVAELKKWARSRAIPTNITKRRCSFVSCRQGIFVGMARLRAHFFSSATSVRYRGLVQGSIAPSSSDLLGSGTTRLRSKSIVLPKPWQRGHAP